MRTVDHSFAVVAYGNSPFLSQCIESLKGQTVNSLIYITTSTPSEYIREIAKLYGVSLFITEAGQGMAHDWNFALSKATTKYVTIAHQDDIYLPRYAAECIGRCERYTDTLIAFTDYSELVNGKERTNTTMLKVKKLMLFCFMPFKQITNAGWKKFSLSFGNYISCPTVMFNRQNIGDFKFLDRFKVDLDWEAWYRLSLMRGRFVFVDKILVQHRIHEASETSSAIETSVRQQEDLIMFQRFWNTTIARLLARFYSASYRSNKT